MKNKSRFIFIFGGARSGKSRYAVELAKKITKKVVFIATATAVDKEMEERIKRHQNSRPSFWKLVEERKNISSVLSRLQNKYEVVLIDCLGLWISNLMAEKLSDKNVYNYPNPCSEKTTIRFSLDKNTEVKILITDANGNAVWQKILSPAETRVGINNIEWNLVNDSGNRVSNGVYILKVISGDVVVNKKIAVVK